MPNKQKEDSVKENNMFNPEQKKAFIENQMLLSNATQGEKIEQGLNNFFGRLAEFEKQKNKDFAMMNNEEIDDVLSKFLKGGKMYKSTSLSFLTKYFEWCLSHQLTLLGQNVLLAKNINSIDTSLNYANIMLKDEEDLKTILNKVFNPADDETVDNLYRCYLHLLFSGLSVDEAFNLLEQDIHLDENYVLVKNKKIVLSKITHDLVKSVLLMPLINRYVFKSIRSDYIIKTGYLFENTVGREKKEDENYRISMKKTWDVSISKKFSDSERAITQKTIMKSGVFYRMYLNEEQNSTVDCREYLEMYRDNATTIDNPNFIISNCKNEYTQWKKAFGLDK